MLPRLRMVIDVVRIPVLHCVQHTIPRGYGLLGEPSHVGGAKIAFCVAKLDVERTIGGAF